MNLQNMQTMFECGNEDSYFQRFFLKWQSQLDADRWNSVFDYGDGDEQNDMSDLSKCGPFMIDRGQKLIIF